MAKRTFRNNKHLLDYFYNTTDRYVLKGGTALLKCYGLDRFSEDLDFDGFDSNIESIVDNFCRHYNYTYRIGKETETVKRYFIHYGGAKPLKVEISYRNKELCDTVK